MDKPVRMLLGDYPLTQALKKGEVKSGTVNLEFADVKTVSTAFKRVVRNLEFDCSELAIVTFLMAKASGKPLVLFLMVCVWSGDIAALYVGRQFGRHKLTRLSPNKTWEGTLASVAGSVLAGLAVVYAGEFLSARGNTLLHIVEPVWQSALLAIIINIAAQLGDLVESAIKRGVGAKDSGTLLPGHGGVLDRIDSLILAGPVVWAAYQWLAK